MRYFKFALFCGIAFAVIALSVSYLRKTSTSFNFFFSPKDLYSELAISDFDFSGTQSERNLDFIHKYPGNHQISILVENPAEITEPYVTDFIVRIAIYNKTEKLLERISSDSNRMFWGGATNSGFSLLHYKVPDDLPIGVELRANIVITEPDLDFESRYGKQRIRISKFSDE